MPLSREGRCKAAAVVNSRAPVWTRTGSRIYLQGIEGGEIIETVRTRRAPVIPAAAALASWCLSSKAALLSMLAQCVAIESISVGITEAG